MLPGDEFPDLIKSKIDSAKVVIVIWTANSVKSQWVRAEAARGDQQGKLITVHAPGVDFKDIPLPFNTRHEAVTNRKLYAALLGRGVAPVTRSPERKPGEDADNKRGETISWYRTRQSPISAGRPILAMRARLMILANMVAEKSLPQAAYGRRAPRLHVYGRPQRASR